MKKTSAFLLAMLAASSVMAASADEKTPPAAEGSGTVFAASNAAEREQAPAIAVLLVSKNNGDFGRVPAGGVGRVKYKLSNLGPSETLDGIKISSTSKDVRVVGCQKPLPPAGSCEISLEWRPRSEGWTVGKITVSSDAPNSKVSGSFEGMAVSGR